MGTHIQIVLQNYLHWRLWQKCRVEILMLSYMCCCFFARCALWWIPSRAKLFAKDSFAKNNKHYTVCITFLLWSSMSKSYWPCLLSFLLRWDKFAHTVKFDKYIYSNVAKVNQIIRLLHMCEGIGSSFERKIWSIGKKWIFLYYFFLIHCWYMIWSSKHFQIHVLVIWSVENTVYWVTVVRWKFWLYWRMTKICQFKKHQFFLTAKPVKCLKLNCIIMPAFYTFPFNPCSDIYNAEKFVFSPVSSLSFYTLLYGDDATRSTLLRCA